MCFERLPEPEMQQTSIALTIHEGFQVDEDMAPGGAASPTISASSATASHTLFTCLDNKRLAAGI